MAALAVLDELKAILNDLVFGVLIATLLFGVIMVQTYHVMISESHGKWLKPLVAAVFAVETFHTLLLWIYLRSIVITDYGNPFGILKDHWTFDLSLALFGIGGEPVRAYFTYRTYVLSNRRRSVCIPLWILELINGGLTITIAFLAHQCPDVRIFQARYGPLVSTALILSVFVDTSNTGTLCWYMHKNSHGLEGMRTVSRKVIMYALETGILTCVAALVTLCLYLLQPNGGSWVATLMVYSKLYSNAFLACLGSRGRLRQYMANDIAEASDRRNMLQLGVADPPRSPSPKFLHASPGNDSTQDRESYPLGTLSSRHDSYWTDRSTPVTGSTHTP